LTKYTKAGGDRRIGVLNEWQPSVFRGFLVGKDDGDVARLGSVFDSGSGRIGDATGTLFVLSGLPHDGSVIFGMGETSSRSFGRARGVRHAFDGLCREAVMHLVGEGDSGGNNFRWKVRTS
jgi:hypothetical protein